MSSARNEPKQVVPHITDADDGHGYTVHWTDHEGCVNRSTFQRLVQAQAFAIQINANPRDFRSAWLAGRAA